MPLKWRKVLIADERYESAGVFDVNGDGHPDIVSGAYWYEGPAFRNRHRIAEVAAYGEYFDDFSTIPLDVNGNGRLDVVTGGWFGKALRWLENPGGEGDWPAHVIAQCGNVETTRAWDVDGDGLLEIVPNTPNDPLVIYKLRRDSAGRGVGEFEACTLYSGKQGHGLGFGDVNGDGRGEIILPRGWLEAPAGDPLGGLWTYHEELDLGVASIPILVADVKGDGLSDLIVGGAHSYGLDWYEQAVRGGARTWVRHPIDPYNSQYHDLQWADIDGDGQMEFVTGKRYRAHNDGDAGARDDVGIYYFKWTGEGFAKQIIDYGPACVGKGCGIMFAIADVNGDGLLDLVAPGKDGLYLYLNQGL